MESHTVNDILIWRNRHYYNAIAAQVARNIFKYSRQLIFTYVFNKFPCRYYIKLKRPFLPIFIYLKKAKKFCDIGSKEV